MFEKYLRTIFGVSSSESVAFYKNKLRNVFSWVLHVFFLKNQP